MPTLNLFSKTQSYLDKWNESSQAMPDFPEDLQREIIRLVTNSFQTGMVAAIAKLRKLPGAAKKFGFAL
jgi:hypothetical protein